MALPTGEKTAAVIENEEAIADQKEALAEVIQEAEAESGSTEIQESEASSALAKSSGIQGNPLQELEEQGFSDLQIDWTSFPTINLDNATFNAPGNKNFAQELNFKIIERRNQWLYRGQEIPKDRNAKPVDPELVYSSDQKTSNDGEPLGPIIEEWKAKGWEVSTSPYTVVLVVMEDGDYAGELVQLQISKTSRGVFDGYLLTLQIQKRPLRDTLTRATIGEEVGSGVRAFNPWVFKRVVED